MKSVLRPLAFAAVLLSLAACASAPSYQPPPAGAAQIAYKIGPAAALAKGDHMHRYLDDADSIVYFQNYGGGGAALGVLAGPLGVAANIGMIAKVTEADAEALRGKLDIDVGARFNTALASHPALSANENGVLLSPYLLVEKVDDAHIAFAALLFAQSSAGDKKWSRRYIYELPEHYSRADLSNGLSSEQIAAIADSFGAGMNWNLATLEKETKGEIKPGTKQLAHSDFITPRIQIAQLAYRFDDVPGRASFVSGDAIYSLEEGSVKFTD